MKFVLWHFFESIIGVSVSFQGRVSFDGVSEQVPPKRGLSPTRCTHVCHMVPVSSHCHNLRHPQNSGSANADIRIISIRGNKHIHISAGII